MAKDDDDKPVEVTEEDITKESEGPTTEEKEPEQEIEEQNPESEEPKGPNVFQKFLAKYKAKKKISIPLTVLFLLVILFGLPTTRYSVLGLAIKKDFPVTVLDSQTSIPVSGVTVNLQGKTAKTDGQGNATVKNVKVGAASLTLSKKYYKDTSAKITVPISKAKTSSQFKLEATGRQVPIHITNKISGLNIAGATLHAADTEAQTDKNGEATIVLPANQSTTGGTLSAEGFNERKVTVTVNQQAVKDNTFDLTPSGKVYFLSKLSGKIDVVKTDLDGTNRQTVVAGTGSEEETGTLLLASRDWKYLGLLSKRDNTSAKLYLITTSNDQMTEIDSGDVSFNIVGWDDHHFVYTVSRNNIHFWQANKGALKSYDADSQQLTTIDQTAGEGSSDSDYANESIANPYLLDNRIIYAKTWDANYYSKFRLANKRMAIYSVKSGGSDKQTVKDFALGSGYNNISITLSKPDELYFKVNNETETYYELADGDFKQVEDLTQENFYKLYPTYLFSPAGNATFWSEPRDGKNTLFVGDSNGDNGKQIAALSEYTPYGWYSDDYLLVSKSGSELYILSKNPADKAALKVSDYHKPAITLRGYGGGYGGL